jgi:hypothetical protein
MQARNIRYEQERGLAAFTGYAAIIALGKSMSKRLEGFGKFYDSFFDGKSSDKDAEGAPIKKKVIRYIRKKTKGVK